MEMKKRWLQFDAIRIVATIQVILLHVTTYIMVCYPNTKETAFLCANILNGFCRAGTPMFLMLSGALLLDEDKPLNARTFYGRYLRSICLLLIFWLFFYATWRSFLLPSLRKARPDKELFFDYILTLRGFYPHLWYLFMLVGTYLSIPVLRLFVKRENKSYILGIIILAMVSQFSARTLGILTRTSTVTVSGFISKFHVEYVSGYLPFLLIGWYLTNCLIKKRARIILYLAGIISVITIILAVQFLIEEIPGIRDYVAEMNTLPAVIYGASLFTAINFCIGKRETNCMLIKEISKASFGVYVVHVAFLDLFTTVIFPYRLWPNANPIVYIVLIFGLTYCSSLGTVLLLSRIPVLRKLFHY